MDSSGLRYAFFFFFFGNAAMSFFAFSGVSNVRAASLVSSSDNNVGLFPRPIK